jgi:hypothetical protein
MPFPSTLDAGQITQVRADAQDFEHYLLATPNDIVWQAEVNQDISGLVFAEFDWTNTLQGVRTNVIEGQLLLITTAADDFTNPVIRGRVRKVPDATDVFINEVAINIDTSMYVTVIDDFDIMEKLIKVDAAGDQFKDWDIVWEDLPPIISGLQSVYADFSESDPVAFTFSPSAIAAASGATISTWAWDIGDGSFTGGTSSSDQNIQCTFPGFGTNEHRWVHLTVTDDNGNSTTIHFEVFTVSKNSSTAAKLSVDGFQITGTLSEGWNATITAFAGFANTTIWDQNRMAIASIDNYGGTATPIVSNIMMVGRLRTENNPTDADELAGLVAESQLQIEGFATQLARISSPRLPIFDEDSPDSWGEIADPTLTRLTAYIWAFHSTMLGISSISFDDFSSFISDDFKIEDSNLLDVINSDANSINGQVAFAPSGEITIRRNNNYLSSTDRDARDTIFDFQTQDITSYQLDIEYGQSIGQVIVGGLVYSTSLNEIASSWIARSPPQAFGTGYETSVLNGQILTADATEANARIEMAQRAANHKAYINPKPRLTVTLIDGFWFLIPTIHQWYTFTLAADTNARGRAYTTNDRWLLVDVDYAPFWDDTEKVWLRETNATFELETTSDGAAIDIEIVPPLNDNVFAPPPNSGYMAFPEDPLVDYATDTPTSFSAFGSTSFINEPYPESLNKDSEPGTETLNIPLNVAKTVSTTRDSVLGETYLVEVDGDGIVAAGWSGNFDFTLTNGNFVQYAATDAENYGVYGNPYWIQTWSGGNNTGCAVERDFDVATTLTYAALQYFHTNSGIWDGTSNHQNQVHIRGVGATTLVGVLAKTDPTDVTPPPELLEWSGTQAVTTGSSIAFAIQSAREFGGSGEQGDVTILSLLLEGTGTPPFGFGAGDRGDAFYRGYDTDSGATLYGGSNGLQVDGARPSGIPPFRSNHTYRFEITGTGDPFEFTFQDSDYSDNDDNILRIKIAGPNMGNTA